MPISYLKWAGGKFKVASVLLSKFTKSGRLDKEYWSVSSGQQYHEWFCGGFSMYFVLREKGFIHIDANAYLNDFSKALINSAQVIQSMPAKSIFQQLEILRLEYIDSLAGREIPRNENDVIREKRYYYLRRREFNNINSRLESNGVLSELEQLRLCSLMIFLNKTCFNGIYRVNKNGEMNVPEGDYPDLGSLRTEKEIQTCAKLFKKALLSSGDWRGTLSLVKKGDLVYLDPPYAKLSNKKGFTTYSTSEFSEPEQFELANQACQLVRDRGCRVIASNHNTKWVQDVYRKAAKKAGIEVLFRKIEVSRSVSREGSGRKSASELLMFISTRDR